MISNSIKNGKWGFGISRTDVSALFNFWSDTRTDGAWPEKIGHFLEKHKEPTIFQHHSDSSYIRVHFDVWREGDNLIDGPGKDPVREYIHLSRLEKINSRLWYDETILGWFWGY